MSDSSKSPDDWKARRQQIIGLGDRSIRKSHYSELLRRMEELRQAKETAEAASGAKDQFLAMLSHELRTPLTPALLILCGMEEDPRLPADLKEDLSTARRNIELEARLIDDLLDLTRVLRGRLRLEMCEVDLARVVRDAVAICSAQARAKGLRVELELESGPIRVMGDPARLQQIFWNLIANAIKFTPPHGIISVRSHCHEEQVILEVRDSGIGIEPEALKLIFEPFVLASRMPGHSSGGLGLGLAIARQLVSLHGGTIEAASEGAARGATFTVKLPVLRAHQPAGDSSTAASPSPAPWPPASPR